MDMFVEKENKHYAEMNMNGSDYAHIEANIQRFNNRLNNLEKTLKDFVTKFEGMASRLSAIEKAVNNTEDFEQKVSSLTTCYLLLSLSPTHFHYSPHKQIIPGLNATVSQPIIAAAFQLEDVKSAKYLAEHIPAFRATPQNGMWETFPDELKKNYVQLFRYVVSEKFLLQNDYAMPEKDILRDSRILKSRFQKQIANNIRYSKSKVSINKSIIRLNNKPIKDDSDDKMNGDTDMTL